MKFVLEKVNYQSYLNVSLFNTEHPNLDYSASVTLTEIRQYVTIQRLTVRKRQQEKMFPFSGNER